MPSHAATLIQSLQDPAIYDHEVTEFSVIETHISWVLLTGPYAYKLKKPINLGFLDFSTLERRRFYCQEELKLNRRLAPRLYLDVVSITGTPARPALNGAGPVLDYAVKMIEFPQNAQLDRVLARGELTKVHIDALARKLAAFHSHIDVAGQDAPYGAPEQIQEIVIANFDRVLSTLSSSLDIDRLQALRTWTESEYDKRRDALRLRKRQGFVRECHGDMHLRNMALLDGELLVFDCIEFNDALRWIDVISEVAFAVMDLDDRGHPELGNRLLNAYLEHTGDYDGVKLLRYYLTYRAMVRAMVDSIRASQSGITEAEKQKALDEYRSYIALAEKYTHMAPPALIITHGFSGSGKTTVAQALLESLPAIRVRSDVERKRLYGLMSEARTKSETQRGLYTAEATERTYGRLAELASILIDAGYTVIVDAAFLKAAQRNVFRALAEQLSVPFVILDCQATESALRQRVSIREREARDASDATVAVLAHQLATHEPLGDEEERCAMVIDTTEAVNGREIARALAKHMQRV